VRDFRVSVVIGGLVLAAVALALLLRSATPRGRRGGLTIGVVAAASLILPFGLAAVGIDFVDVRNLIGALVPLLVGAGIGFGCARAGRLGQAAAGAAVLVFIAVLVNVYAHGQMQRPDWRGAATAMGPPSGQRVLVVARNGNEPIGYYRDASEFRPPRFPHIWVKEIDVLSTLGTISPPGHGFRLTERRGLAPCCTLWRYLARRPTLVRPADVNGRQILQERSSVLVEKPARGDEWPSLKAR
jgi:hypothetical protein